MKTKFFLTILFALGTGSALAQDSYSEITIVDPNFTEKTGNIAGGTTTYWNDATNHTGWVSYTTDSKVYFRVGDGGTNAEGEYIYDGINRASIWRGYTGNPRGSLYQEVTVTKAGHYEFTCQAYCISDDSRGMTYRTINVRTQTDFVYNEDTDEWEEQEVEIGRDTTYYTGIYLVFGSAEAAAQDSIEIYTGVKDGTTVYADYTPWRYSIGYDKTTDGEEVLKFGLDGLNAGLNHDTGNYCTYAPNAYGIGSVRILYYPYDDSELIISQDETITSENISTIINKENLRLNINEGASLTISEDATNVAEIVINSLNMDSNFRQSVFAQIMSAANGITITGDLTQRIYTQGMTWNFMSLPFDCDLSRLVNEGGSPYAIRYYDGASRAATATAQGNWRDYGQNDIIPMGTGFIFMTRDDSWTRFYAADNETKARLFASTANSTSLGLAQNESAVFAHQGWNLVGNPYANYYDGGHVDFGKALTLWNGSTYEACYTGDDAFVIRPNQAFFVQCPREGDSAIGFPGAGRQLTATPTSGAKARTARRNPNRRLVNLSLTDRTFTDKTRIVLNEEAREDYELDCDAGKFMSLRPEVPQLYSIGRDGTHYAINERPLSDGKVSLGIYIPEDGEYTISVTRNDAERVRLSDSETGQTVDLDEGGYTFQARKGTYARRLSLWIDTDATGIIEIASEGGADSPASWYTMDGRPLQGQPSTTGVYLVKEGSVVRKMYVKK